MVRDLVQKLDKELHNTLIVQVVKHEIECLVVGLDNVVHHFLWLVSDHYLHDFTKVAAESRIKPLLIVAGRGLVKKTKEPIEECVILLLGALLAFINDLNGLLLV